MSIAAVDTGGKSPGRLASVHGTLVELAGSNSCAMCHGGLFQNMAGACLDCHEAVADDIDAGRGLHGRLAPDPMRCAACHSDHHGDEFSLVNAISFGKAGIANAQEFDHNSIGFDMRGAHLELACTECHDYAEIDVLPEGSQRFMGLSKRCASCHEDEHDGALGQTCNSCHVQASFETLWSRGHDERLPLVGGHSGLSCRACHGAESRFSLEAHADGDRAPAARACVRCHESPHASDFAAGVAQIAGLPQPKACVACHLDEHESFRDEALELGADEHFESGFALTSPHDDVTCAQCHDPQLEAFAMRYPGRESDGCAACHEDPHGGQFDDGPFAAEGCVACHDREHFEPHGFDVELHAQSGMALMGSHLSADCDDCHQDPAEGHARLFRGLDNNCDSCHGDAHAGAFDLRTAELDPLDQGDCARCHQSTEFADLDRAAFDHARWTGFPIQGAHEAEGCASCHAPLPEPDELGRLFGRIRPAHGEIGALHGGPEVGQACAACHADPHDGRFDGGDLPVRFEEREGCARCHVETSFRDLSLGFDHGRCSLCSLPPCGVRGEQSSLSRSALRPASEAGRTWKEAAGSACADCHQDPHGRQFEDGGRTDCAACHNSASTFADLRFDHNWDSSFKLDATHSALECAECHVAEGIGGHDIVRYRPLGQDCADCHGLRATSLRGGGGDGR